MNKYNIIDIASPELPMPGPDGKPQRSLPIISALDRNRAIGEAMRRWPSHNLLEAFYNNLEVNINGLIPEQQRKVNNPFVVMYGPEEEEEYIIDALQLAGYLVHGRNPDVIAGEATDLSVVMYFICDAIKTLKPLIITGIHYSKLCDDFDKLTSIERLLVINTSKQLDCYAEKTDLIGLVFVNHIKYIMDMVEGKDVYPLRFNVPASPTLSLRSSQTWHALFESSCEQTLSREDIKGFQSISIIIRNQS
jgi:hypothetical protein